jgi:hypothetical protein
MRKLVLILIALIAVVTFIRAFDNTGRDMDRAVLVSEPSSISAE